MRAADFVQHVLGAVQHGDQWMGFCPGHDDRQNRSLSFSDGDRGVMLHCFAGCTPQAIVAACGLTMRDLFFNSEHGTNRSGQNRRVVAVFDYVDEAEQLLFQVVRNQPKQFSQRRPDGHGGWVWTLQGVVRPLYRLPAICRDFSGPVIFHEGENACEAAVAAGLLGVHTTTSGGASNGHLTDVSVCEGRDVLICPDRDAPGQRYATLLAERLVQVGATSVRIVLLPNLPEHGDVVEWLAGGGTPEQFSALCEAAPEWTTSAPKDSTTDAADEQTAEVEIRFTDLGNAERFARQHRDSARYCFPCKAWFICNPVTYVWERCLGDRVVQLAKSTIMTLYDDARNENDDARRTKIAAHAVKSEGLQRLQATTDLARSEPGLAIAPDAFDADPWLLSVINGVLDLRTGTLRARRREDLLSKLAPVAFDPSASCPGWLRFLGRIFEYDAGLIRYMQEITGYCLTGLTTEQAFFLLWGSGSNGKSTFLKVLLRFFGDYGLQVPADTFLSRMQDGRATPDLARLQGARLAVAIESDEGCRLAEGAIKQMTGGDRIAARRLYEDFIEFEPTHKILFATNHKPRVRDNTHAMWRRMRLIPFEVQIPDGEQDSTLAATLIGELPGILNWALHGCLAWQQAGRLHTPEPVTVATAAYRTEQDVLDDFLRERCVRGEQDVVKFSELRGDYCDWAKCISERPLSPKGFGAALQERGFVPTLIRNTRHYCGLRLRTVSDDVEPHPIIEPDPTEEVSLR